MPAETHNESPIDGDGLNQWANVDIINDLPAIEAGQQNNEVNNHRSMALSETNLIRIRHTAHNGGSRMDWPDELVLECHRGEANYSDVYGRMNSNNLAPTITAGCLCYSKGRFGHPTQDRAISAREAARLQTFDDDFIFEGSLGSIGKQIGNAVPPNLAEASGRYIISLINEYMVPKE